MVVEPQHVVVAEGKLLIRINTMHLVSWIFGKIIFIIFKLFVPVVTSFDVVVAVVAAS